MNGRMARRSTNIIDDGFHIAHCERALLYKTHGRGLILQYQRDRHHGYEPAGVDE